MAYKLKFGDRECSIGALSIDTLQTIADEEGVTWIVVMDGHPATNITRFRKLVAACAQQLGIPEPPPIVSGDDFLDAGFGENSIVEETVDIGDRPMIDGDPPTPDEPAGDSSATSPGATTGLPTSPDDSQSTTS